MAIDTEIWICLFVLGGFALGFGAFWTPQSTKKVTAPREFYYDDRFGKWIPRTNKRRRYFYNYLKLISLVAFLIVAIVYLGKKQKMHLKNYLIRGN